MHTEVPVAASTYSFKGYRPVDPLGNGRTLTPPWYLGWLTGWLGVLEDHYTVENWRPRYASSSRQSLGRSMATSPLRSSTWRPCAPRWGTYLAILSTDQAEYSF